MTENLISGLGAGLDIETTTESMILLDFIRDNWTLVDPSAASIDFGAHPSRTTSDVTLNCYRRSSTVRDLAIGGTSYKFNVLVGIDVYMREVMYPGLKDIPPRLMAVESYLREFISLNRLSLRDAGINNISLEMIENVQDPSQASLSRGSGLVWYHSVITVRMIYSMFRATT